MTAFLLFCALTLMVAIIPALDNQRNNAPLPASIALSEDAIKGKNVFISNGCVGCHTQQVRSIAMDETWGDRPSMAADYADNHRTSFLINTATLMGTERTGPDLTNAGSRQPGREWHLLHLYNPRAVVTESIMPAYPWLFEIKTKVNQGDVIVNVPEKFFPGPGVKIVAGKEALYLTAYLQTLKQAPLPMSIVAMPFLNKKSAANEDNNPTPLEKGRNIYAANCQTCHQSNGEGVQGAFPPLKGSPIVLGDNIEQYVDIVMNGYDAREEYGVMPAVGKNMKFSAEDLTALINYERASWGNSGKPVSLAEVQKIMDFLKTKN